MYNRQAFDDVPRVLSESGRDLVRSISKIFVMNLNSFDPFLCRVMQVWLNLISIEIDEGYFGYLRCYRMHSDTTREERVGLAVLTVLATGAVIGNQDTYNLYHDFGEWHLPNAGITDHPNERPQSDLCRSA